MRNVWLDAMMGLAVGDALGVPVEFMNREILKNHPMTDMIGWGTHNQAPGTWSDDSSMAFATLDSLRRGYNLEDIMERFVAWVRDSEYTPYDDVFDIGITTSCAIRTYMQTKDARNCGGSDVRSNGNGSLMRIMPLALYCYFRQKKICTSEDESIQMLHDVSALTHGHIRSQMACGLFYFVVKAMLEGTGALKDRLQQGFDKGFSYYQRDLRNFTELSHYGRLRDMDELSRVSQDQIQSSGYVVATFEAAIWCLLTTEDYRSCVLKAVNLGEDTDTVGAVAGALAGLYYGVEAIPEHWVAQIARKEWIEELCNFEMMV